MCAHSRVNEEPGGDSCGDAICGAHGERLMWCGHVRAGGGVHAAPHRGAQVGVHALCGMCAEKTKKKRK